MSSCRVPDNKTGKRKKSSCNAAEKDHHFLSIYRHKKVDFKELATICDDFDLSWKKLKKRRKEIANKEKEKGTCFSTFVDFEFNSTLTRALLKHDFRIELPALPEGTLCPPVPNRLNYVCWIRELLNCFLDDENEHDLQAGNEHCRGIDIGTGSSCIYPLLICAARDPKSGELIFNPKWRMDATDIDPVSVSCALKNVNANHLGQRIDVHLVSDVAPTSNDASDVDVASAGPLQLALDAANNLVRKDNGTAIDGACNQMPSFDFVMTNPPFYETKEEATEVRKGDGRSRIDMTFSESVYEHGGELGFVKSILRDSFRIQNRVRWYTSMFARKSSLVAMEKLLREAGLGYQNVRTTKFQQGKTTRFGVAWTFSIVPLRSVAARVSNDVFTFEVSTNHESQIGAIDEVTSRICKFCEVFPKKKVQLQYNITTSQNSRAIEIFAATFCPQEIEVSTNGKTKLTQLTQPGKCDDVLISVQLRNVLSKKEETGCKIKVLLKCYSRSKEGNQIITIVQNSLRGEVTRTNRKWNRSKRRESNAKTES